MTTENESIKGKAPAYQYYPADWLNDPALQSCSLYARGLWHEINSRMWACEPQGHLVLNGKAYTLPQLARFVREPEKAVKAALEELKVAGVYSETADGVIFSRRMVRDVHNRKVRAEGGRLGGNPSLTGKGKDKRKVNLPTNQDEADKDNPKPTPSSSSSTSVGEDKSSPAGGGGAEVDGGETLPLWLVNELRRYPASWGEPFRPVWQGWLEYLAGVLRKAPPFQTVDSHREILSGCGSDAIRIQFVNTAIARGFREPCAPKKTEGVSAKPLTTEKDHATGWR